MMLSRSALALSVALGSFAAAVPAVAQTASASAQAAPAVSTRKFNLSPAGRKAIVALQAAVKAKDAAAIATTLAAAQAAAKTPDDKYVVAQLQLKAAIDANANTTPAIEAMLASGGAEASEISPLLINLGKNYYNARDFTRASAAFENLIAKQPTNSEAIVLLGETRNAQGRTGDAVGLFRQAIALRTASGQKAPEEWYKRALKFSYDQKLPSTDALAMEWVKAYPTASAWRDTLRIHQVLSPADDNSALDLLRLARASGALAGESDYYRYANLASARGFPGEAKAVLEEGFAARAIDRSKPIFREVLASAAGKVAADRASLPALEKAALAASTAKGSMVTGDAYLGYGDYAKAAALYRAALGKTGVDANLANLRLGIALARSGDKAGATAALNAVGGASATTAKYWLLWLATRA